MNRVVISTLLIFGLGACNEKPKNDFIDKTEKQNIETSDSKYSTINLQFNSPTVLDSSDWVIYPLTLEELEETETGFKSSSYDRQYAYWNIAFFNIETNQTRLLSDSLKMLIHSFSPISEWLNKSAQRSGTNEGFISYTITTRDSNSDGKLDFGDSKYLFISELSGQNFLQISPDNFDVIHWQPIDATRKIIIQARRDSNQDKNFDGADEIISFVYEIESQKLAQVFSSDFNLATKKLLDSQWKKKK